MPSTSRRLRHGVLGALAAVLLTITTACSSDGDTDPTDPDDRETSVTTYCDIIPREAVVDIVGDLEIEASGGPTRRTGGRLVQCSLNAPERGAFGTVLTVETRELGAPELADPEQQRFAAGLAAARGGAEFVESDDATLRAFASYDGERASASLLTDDRAVYVSAPVEADRAATITPQLLELVQLVDENLDAWDADHPS